MKDVGIAGDGSTEEAGRLVAEQGTRPVRVAIVNDYEIVVRGLAQMVERYADRVDVVELDVREPVSSPVDVALYDTFAQPQGNDPDIDALLGNPLAARVAVYTWNFHEHLVRDSLAKGVAGYLSKTLSAADLVRALERIHGGERIVTPTPTHAPTVGGSWPGRAEGLTNREAEVIALITQGFSNEEIAARTFLSINSVKSYIRNSYRKMGVTTRAQAVLWGVDHGLRPDHHATDSWRGAHVDHAG